MAHQRPSLPTAAAPEDALGAYLRAILRHRVLIVLVILSVLAGAGAWLAVRVPTYVATAEVLVTPLPQEDTTLLGLQLVRDSGDPTRTVQTAAEILSSSEAARATAAAFDRRFTRRQVEEAIDVEPRGETDVIAVSAQAPTAGLAQALANVYTEQALAEQLRTLRRSADVLVERLAGRPEALIAAGDETTAAEIATRISQLEALRRGRDPTLNRVEVAELPESPIGIPPWLVLMLAGLAGLVLAAGSAMLAELATRRIRDEEELEVLYPLPVLAEVPRHRPGHLEALERRTPPAVLEAYRLLAVQLSSLPGDGRVIMVTSPSPGDGKSTASAELAFALVAAGHDVLLLDLDMRKPDLGERLGVPPEVGVETVLAGQRALSDVVMGVPLTRGLKIAQSGPMVGGSILPDVLPQRMPALLAEARELAEIVVVDTPPLGVISDGLAVGRASDDIVLVVRPGRTDRWHLQRTRDLLERSVLPARGFVVIGSRTAEVDSYYGYGGPPSDEPERRRRSGALSSARR